MSKPLLSILIPTVVGREAELDRLLQELYRQRAALPLPNIVQFQVKKDNKEISIGAKRDLMYKESIGEYSVMWDDDDGVASNGLSLILEALKQKPDTCTYQEHCNMDGVELMSNFSLQYPDWEGDGSKILSDGFHLHRTPFFKTPIRTDLCQMIGVEDCRFGEDHIFSRAIKPILATEVHIPEFIYYYQHISTPHNERYGIKEM